MATFAHSKELRDQAQKEATAKAMAHRAALPKLPDGFALAGERTTYFRVRCTECGQRFAITREDPTVDVLVAHKCPPPPEQEEPST